MAERAINLMLAAFEDAFDLEPAQYEPVIEAFRQLVVPADVTDAELTRLYSICYAILGIEPAQHGFEIEQLDGGEAQHLVACAREVLESTMYDREAENREWLVEMQEAALLHDEELPEEFSGEQLPPALAIPWDEETAWRRIRPFLGRCHMFIEAQPLFHLPLVWNVMRSGYPVFQKVVARWLDELAERGLGLPGTREAIHQARELEARTEELAECDWDEVSAELLPLFEHAHPLVAAGAARALGLLSRNADPGGGASAEELALFDGWPDLPELLELLRRAQKHRLHTAGGFIDGWDEGIFEGMYGLKFHPEVQAAGLDFDQWVLDIFAQGEDEPYLPNAQSFWFYVHESYDRDPAFINRLIDAGHMSAALMCASESDEPVDGMPPVLQRLVSEAPVQVAEAAQAHLARIYEG